MDLNSVKLFVRVVQKGSFSAASRFTGTSVATVSRRVHELEQSLNVRLLERSTRQLRLTGAGSTLYDFVSRGLEEMDAGVLALQNRETELRGTLRLSLPRNFEPWWALLHDFQDTYSHIKLDIYATERNIDFIEDGIDVALRIGKLDDLSAVARKLIDYHHVLVATPEFIKSFGCPESPDDLQNFPCVAWGNRNRFIEWHLGDQKLIIEPYMRANDYNHLRYLTLQNRCITEQPPFMVHELIAQNRLVQILPDYNFPSYSVSLLYQSRHQLSHIARVYIDYCISNSTRYLNVDVK